MGCGASKAVALPVSPGHGDAGTGDMHRHPFATSSQQSSFERSEPWLDLQEMVDAATNTDTGTLEIKRGSDMMSALPDGAAVNLAAIFGKARCGKSTLMSIVSGVSGLFEASGQSLSFTKGIKVGNHFPSIQQLAAHHGCHLAGMPAKSDVRVGFVDAEGQGAKSSQSYDVKLIAIPMLFSRVIIFNWIGGLQEGEILDKLGVMTQVAMKYKVTADEADKQFGCLHIVFNRVGAEEMKEGVEKRRADLLDLENKPLNGGANSRDDIRRLLVACFESIDCHLLPTFPDFPNPLVLSKLPDEALPGEYKRRTRIFCAKLVQQLQTPRMVRTGSEPAAVLTGRKIHELAHAMAPQISQDKTFVMSQLEAMAAAHDMDKMQAENEALKEQTRLAEEKTRLAEEKVRQAEKMAEENARLQAELEQLRKVDQNRGGETAESRKLKRKITEQLVLTDAKDDEVQPAELPSPAGLPEDSSGAIEPSDPALSAEEGGDGIDLLVHTLLEKLGLPEQMRFFVTELARAVHLHCSELQQSVDDPAQLVPMLLRWARESPRCEHALPNVQAALQSFLRGRAERIPQPRVQAAALAAVDDFVLSRDHFIMLLEGRLFELIKSILGSAAVAALDQLTAGIQQRLENAVDLAERGEEAVVTTVSALDGIGSALGEDSVGSELFEKAIEAGRSAPVIGPLFAAIDGLYKVLKGAKANKEAYAVFRRQLEADVQLLSKANEVPGVAESVRQVQDVVQRATAFVEKAEQRGLMGQLWHAKNDKAELKALGKELQQAMGRLQTDLMISVATSPQDRERVTREVGEKRQVIETQIEHAIQQDQENERKLCQRFEQARPCFAACLAE
eukprot:COSAG01_NODE_4870_length_4665_cov_84.521463_1_plen_846_part_00